MLFNSNEFLVFFCLFFFFYFLLSRSFRAQNVLVVVSSFLFYGRWSLPFLALLIFTGTVDYLLARQLQAARTNLQKRLLLAVSIILNLAILGYFKYGGFALQIADNWFASQTSASLIWTVVLPVGISFYTFQSISYVVDVYRGTITAERNWITFMSFLTFFPQLVAGPIEPASHLLPQFQRPRETSEPPSPTILLAILISHSAVATFHLPFTCLARSLLEFRFIAIFQGTPISLAASANSSASILCSIFAFPMQRPTSAILGALARQPLRLVPRLRLHSTRRKPRPALENLPQPAPGYAARWPLARSKLDFYPLGPMARRSTGDQPSLAPSEHCSARSAFLVAYHVRDFFWLAFLSRNFS